MVKAVVCCGKFPSNIETVVHRCFIHTPEFAVLVETKQCVFVSVSVCVWSRRWRRESSILIHSCEMEKMYLSGRSWTCLGPQRHTNWMRVCEGASESSASTQKDTYRKSSSLFLLGGYTTRTGLRTETLNGAIVSGTWPDPDRIYTTKPLEVCQSHTCACTHTQQWWRATLVLLGCYANFYPCCSWDYFLTWTISETYRSGDVILQPSRLSPAQAMHTLTHTHTHLYT